MKDREQSIEHYRNYCVHYAPRDGKDGTMCALGLEPSERVSPQPGKPRWAPCMGGHHLDCPHALCSKWERRSRQSGETYADSVGRSIDRLIKASPVISAWRKKEPRGKQEVIECPCCSGKLHLSQSSYNGHVHAKCETAECISFME